MSGGSEVAAVSDGLPDVAALRRSYGLAGLAEQDLAPDWLSQFSRWFAETEAAGLAEPNAMVLATADAAGAPSVRTVLLKGLDARGFVLFTNTGSRKGSDLAGNPRAALLFPWHPLERQVRVEGPVEPVTREETAAYFGTRPVGSRRGSWASRQSSVVADRAELDRQVAEVEGRFGDDVPVPPFWGGYRILPRSVEFWQGRPNRMHDRLRYRLVAEPPGGQPAGVAVGGEWVVERLAP